VIFYPSLKARVAYGARLSGGCSNTAHKNEQTRNGRSFRFCL